VIKRLLVIQPPKLIDFAGGYSAWVKKLATAKSPASPPTQSKPKPAPETKPQNKNTNNPYKRPFGRLSVPELEKEISKTEKELIECQARFADADQFKDPEKGKSLQAEYESLTQKLEQLEAEYFMREE
jgi:hypothetical protein